MQTTPLRSLAARVWCWPLFWLCLFVLVAAWYSLLQLASLAPSDTPLAFVALVPVLAGYLLIHDGRRPATNRDQADPFVDGLAFLILFAVCSFLVFVLPVKLGWYYWLQRLDLLLVPVFATGIVFLFWGWAGVATSWRGLLYLTLVWPYPLVLLQQGMAPILTALTTAFGRLTVHNLALPISVSASDPSRFVGTGAESFAIIIADECSGVNAVIGFLVVGLPLVLTWSGRPSSKVKWLLTGMAMAFFSNLLRVGILLYLSAAHGVEFALGTVHPILGTVLFVGVFMVMLVATRFFRLRFDTDPLSVNPPSQGMLIPDGFRYRVIVVGIAALVLALGQTTLVQFGPLSNDSVPVVSAQEASSLLPNIPGWNRELRQEINWEHLFGPDSQSSVFSYRSGEASVVVQFVATSDKGALDSYSVEQCSLFHGEEVVGVSTVSLGHGISGRLVESKFTPVGKRKRLNANALYWVMPFAIGKHEYNARISLLVDSEMVPREPLPTAAYVKNPVQHAQNWLLSTFSPYSSAQSSPDFAALDSYTLSFARLMVNAIVEKSAASPAK
ncbi:MAG: exosortase/archaeosortase family protein [Chloroflexi bacterium]|nr:exosortase/archaeosortase family protein [Chloroflexota bacterium]